MFSTNLYVSLVISKKNAFLLDTIPIDLATLSTLPKAPWQKKTKGTILLGKCSVCSISISYDVRPHD